jgi:hypothetical protein
VVAGIDLYKPKAASQDKSYSRMREP